MLLGTVASEAGIAPAVSICISGGVLVFTGDLHASLYHTVGLETSLADAFSISRSISVGIRAGLADTERTSGILHVSIIADACSSC